MSRISFIRAAAALSGGLLMASAALAQLPSALDQSAIFGPTPPELLPSDPGRVVPLSNLDSVDLYSGHLNASLPIHWIGGRGDAGYTMTLAISNPPWAMVTNIGQSSSGDYQNTPKWSYFTAAAATWWTSYQPRYSPGFVVVKRSFDNLGTCTGNTADAFYMTTMTEVVFLRPNGSELQLFSSKFSAPIQNASCNFFSLDRGTVFTSQDGSGTWFQASSELSDLNSSTLSDVDRVSVSINGTLYFKNGVQYVIDSGRVRQIIDRNGNETQLSYCGDPGSACAGQQEMLVENITDPVGRTTKVHYGACSAGSGQTCDTITFPGAAGAQRTIKVLWGLPQGQIRPDLSPESLFPQVDYAATLQDLDSVYSVVLPDGVSSYSFYYNYYGELARMVLPTGGAVDYEYGQGLQCPAAGCPAGVYPSGQVLDALDGTFSVSLNQQPAPWQPYIYRRLLKRREYTAVPPAGTATGDLDSLATAVTTYVTSEVPSNPGYYPQLNNTVDALAFSRGPITETVTGTGGVSVQTQHTFSAGTTSGPGNTPRAQAAAGSAAGALSAYQVGPGIPDPLDGVEITTVVPGLQSVSKAYFTNYSDGSGLACQEVTTLLQNEVFSSKLFAYDTYNNPTDIWEYDYGAGPSINTVSNGAPAYLDCPAASGSLTRHTNTAYVTNS